MYGKSTATAPATMLVVSLMFMKEMQNPQRRAAIRSVFAALVGASFFAAVYRYLQPPAAAFRRAFVVCAASDVTERVRVFRVHGMQIALRADSNDGVIAFDMTCTHAGCLVEASRDGFRCPCHGGRFDAAGKPAGGPVQRPLRRLDAKVQDNMVVVRVAAEV